MTYDGSTGTPSITLVNTNFTREQLEQFLWLPGKHWRKSRQVYHPNLRCQPCTVFPFTGKCTNRSQKPERVLRLQCGYYLPCERVQTICLGREWFATFTAMCATQNQMGLFRVQSVFTRTEDCYMSGQVILTGDLNIVGRRRLHQTSCSSNSRHFYVDGDGRPSLTLTLKWLNLTAEFG